MRFHRGDLQGSLAGGLDTCVAVSSGKTFRATGGLSHKMSKFTALSDALHGDFVRPGSLAGGLLAVVRD
jgi:hypothetical protein